MTQSKPGFSILEMMIYLVIVGILMAALIPRIKDAIFKSKEFTAKSTITSITQALREYEIDMGRYPTSREGLDVLIDQRNEPNWKGAYLRSKTVPLDPWGKDFEYNAPPVEFKQYSRFEIFSRDAKTNEPRRAVVDGE